jgi:hypothetical protein
MITETVVKPNPPSLPRRALVLMLLAAAAWFLSATYPAANETPGVVWEFDTGG